MTDPPLVGPDPLWKFLRSGKAHVYYALAGLGLICVLLAPYAPRMAAIGTGLACGCLSDLWAHQYLH